MNHQVKSSWYYIFWGIMTFVVFFGQVVNTSGYVIMTDSVNRLINTIEEVIDE